MAAKHKNKILSPAKSASFDEKLAEAIADGLRSVSGIDVEGFELRRYTTKYLGQRVANIAKKFAI